MPKKTAHKNKAKRTLRKEIIYLCSCCALVFLLLLSAANVKEIVSSQEVLGVGIEANQQNESLISEIKFWEDFLSRTPSYFDGWLELASLQLQVGDVGAADYSLQRAREIDPNSEKLQFLEASAKR